MTGHPWPCPGRPRALGGPIELGLVRGFTVIHVQAGRIPNSQRIGAIDLQHHA